MFSEQTYEILKKRILDNFPLQLEKREGSYSNFLISPICEELAKAYMSMGDIMNLGFIADTFDTYLDKRVGEFGVYRKPGTKSKGSIKVIGKDGTIITNGTVLIFNDLRYIVLNDIVLPNEDILFIEAENVGTEYNSLANSEFKLLETNTDITSLKSIENFKGGVDIETDEELRSRFVKVVNNPSTSWNKAQVEEVSLEVDGVSRVVIYPLWNGNGTVKVLAIGSDNKPVSDDILLTLDEHLKENMPICGGTITVTTPTSLGINIKASLELKFGYTIDDVKSDFKLVLNNYLKNITNELVYSKVYGLIVNLLGVGDIKSFTINDSMSNIDIADDKIIDVTSIDLIEVV